MQSVVAVRAQPRVRFETVPQTALGVLPRMDVAVLAGFAASGPLHVPVVVEDAKQYGRVFGDDLTLAWDAQAGEPVRAHLGPSVRAFFANGGRRCWVIRVADNTAAHNYFPVSGLLKYGTGGHIEPAFARARSEGSWSDSLQLRAALRAVSVPSPEYDLDAAVLTVSGGADSGDVTLPKPGDLLRLGLGDPGQPQYLLFARVESVRSTTTLPTAAVKYKLGDGVWFADVPMAGTMTSPLDIEFEYYSASDELRSSTYFPAADPYSEPAARVGANTGSARLYCPAPGRARLKTTLDTARQAGLQSGIWLGIRSGGDRGWLIVRTVRFALDNDAPLSPPATQHLVCLVEGDLYWTRPTGSPSVSPGTCRSAEIVTFDLDVEGIAGGGLRLADLGCTAQHARGWQTLHGDQGRYLPRPGMTTSALTGEARDATFHLASADGEVPPPSGSSGGDAAAIYLPLGMTSQPDSAVGAVARSESALLRDGLATYDESLFLDPDLASVSTGRLMAEADYLRHLAIPGRPLLGLHAALGFGESTIGEEATIIAAPDAVHRRWRLTAASEAPSDGEDIPTPLPVAPGQEFSDCAAMAFSAPVLAVEGDPGTDGRISLVWNTVAGAQYVLEESRTADFSNPATIYGGRDGAVELDRPAGGAYFFRVRATGSGGSSDWSAPLAVTIPPALIHAYEKPEDYQSDALSAVHCALLRLCAAQGEMFGVLSLPRHFRERDCRTHLGGLKASFAAEHGPLPLSYGAAYHPWPLIRTEASEIFAVPPDGAAVGILASRAAERGAWVAPAGQPMRDIFALTPSLSPEVEDRVPLNLIRNEPRGFQTLRADTLETTERDFRLINVRRLIILIRRLARRYGDVLAFEPNSATLQRLAQRRFEALLRGLYERGALDGPAPELAYQVNTGPSVNTPQSIEAGRFIVELRVRPSLPMEFITIRLVQSGDHLSVSEAR